MPPRILPPRILLLARVLPAVVRGRRKISLACAFLLMAALAVMPAGCSRVETTLPLLPLSSPGVLPDNEPSSAGPSSPGDWPSFRGGLWQGVARDAQLPRRWDDEQGVKWRARLEGTGASSPVISGERVFLTWTRRSTDGEQQIQLACFDRSTGRQLWCRDVGPATGRTHGKNGHASATVAAGGGRVFACDAAGRLTCFDLDGHWIWKTVGEGVQHQWGIASSPVLFGDLVIQLCEGERRAFLAAYRQGNGQLVWRRERESRGCWTTPVLLYHERADAARWEVVVNGTGSSDGSPGWMIAYDPWTGNPLWRVRGTTDIPCPSAMVGDGLVISTTGGNGPILAVRPGGRGDVTESHVVWQRPLGGPYVPTGVVYQRRLYMISDGGVLSCRDVSDGRPLWSKRLGGTYSASLIAGAGLLYAVSEQGDVHVIAAGETFEPVALNRFQERCAATPAVADGLLYIRTENWLYCIEGAEDTTPGSLASGGGPAAGDPAAGDEQVVQ